MVKGISLGDAKELIEKNKNKPDFITVDIRTPEEFPQGNIPNSINISKKQGRKKFSFRLFIN